MDTIKRLCTLEELMQLGPAIRESIKQETLDGSEGQTGALLSLTELETWLSFAAMENEAAHGRR